MEARDELWFGLAAIEAGWIGADQLFAAWRACQGVHQGTLREILVGGKFLSPEQWECLERQAASSLEAGESGPAAGSDTTPLPGAAGKASQVDHDESTWVRGSVLGTRRGSLLSDAQEISTQQRSRYTLSHLHGKGGLGVVWLAVDPQLNRQVALKELRADRAADRMALTRMVKEARITGQLEHPNIVPVYELHPGTHGALPYYTMRFLRGGTFRAAIKEYHKRPREERDALGLRLLLNAFIGVCHAVAYAASKKVVHRDLKPQNIMLGSFGEVVVLDWGLARVLDSTEEEADSAPPLVIGTGGATTLDGQIVGTPAYLSPEQAAGDVRGVDTRTDIYGLGAILFEILVGRPPHRRDVGTNSLSKLLAKIRQEPSPEAKQFDASVPAPLNAICRKAMAREKQDRYPTAAELADDVQRWMADEPVSVYRDPPVERVFRWLRHHRSFAVAAAGSLLLVAVVSAIATAVVHRAWRAETWARIGEQQARQAEHLAREEAVQRFQDARRAVDRSLTGVAEVLEYFPGVQRLRSELLEAAVADYQRFADQRSEDLELQRETARAMGRLGDVRGLLQQWEQAEQQYRQAGEFLLQLLERTPDDADIRGQLAHSRKQLAFAAATLQRHDEAKRLYQTALHELDGLLAADPDSAEHATARGATRIDQAQWLSALGNHAAALESLEHAEEDFRRLYQQQARPEYLRGLAAARRLTGQVHQNLGHLERAEEKLQQAMSDFLTLQHDAPDQPNYLKELADCRINLANTVGAAGRDGEAEQLYLAAAADYQSLLKARPDVPQYLESLALTRHNLALQYYREGDALGASQQAMEALAVFVELVSDYPAIIRYHAEHAASSLTVGQILRELNQEEDAASALDTAIHKFQELAAEFPTEKEHQTNLAISCTSHGLLLHQQGRHEAAESRIRQAIEHLQQRLAEDPQDQPATDALAWAHHRLADVLWDAARIEEAVDCYRHCLELREGLRRPQDEYCLAWFLIHCRDVQSRDPPRATAIAQRLVQQVPGNASYRALLGAAQFRSGQYDAAIATLHEAQRIRERPNALDAVYLVLACHASGRQAEARQQLADAQQLWEETRPGNADLACLFLEARHEAAADDASN